MKAQVLIVQFILFFIIGLSVFFIATGAFDFFVKNFRTQNQMNAMSIICNFMALETVNFHSCRSCDAANTSLILPKKLIGNYYRVFVVNNSLICEAVDGISVNDSLNNLNRIYSLFVNFYSVAENKTFSIDKNQNYLRVYTS